MVGSPDSKLPSFLELLRMLLRQGPRFKLLQLVLRGLDAKGEYDWLELE